MREHKVCKSESPTLSKGHSGAADPNPAVYGKRAFGATAQHRAVKKHFFQSQETSLHNRLFHTVCKVPGEHEWGGRSCSWLGTKSKDAPGTDHRMCHRAPVHSWPEATRLEVSGMGLTKQTESCSWRHIVSWKEQDTGTVWVTWLGLGHEAIVKMGRKCNCKSENRKNASRI